MSFANLKGRPMRRGSGWRRRPCAESSGLPGKSGFHPSRPVLVVEVAETSLALDRLHKGSLYARAGLPDYWILNLVDGVLEVYRQPAPSSSAPFGWAYSEVRSLGMPDLISPLAAPEARIPVAALLP